MQPAEQKEHLCKVMTGAFRRLFQILAEKSDPSDGGMMMLQVANVEFPEYVEPTSPRPFYQRDALDLVDWEDLPVVPCISELALHEHQGERGVFLPTGLQLASRLPNLSRITLGTFHWWGAGVRIMPRVDAVRSWRHELATAFADERLLACPGKEVHVPPSYCVAAAASPENDNGANAPQHYNPLGAAIRTWSQNLVSLEVSGVFDRSLFWPSEAETTQTVAGASTSPHWPNLEPFTTELPPCSSDGTCYFIWDPDAQRAGIYAGREISLPTLGQPNDGTLQPLLASWARALAQMPRLGGLRWSFCAGWRGAGFRGWSWWF
ncbi:Oxoglutarate iron-dependent oxygenase [Apiospora saccharicola]